MSVKNFFDPFDGGSHVLFSDEFKIVFLIHLTLTRAGCYLFYNMWFLCVCISERKTCIVFIYLQVGCKVLRFVLCVGCRFIGCSIENVLYASKLESVKEVRRKK